MALGRARRRARRDPLQHGGDGAAARRPGRNGGRQAARRGEPGDVRRAVARRARSTRCRSPRSPTGCTPRRGSRPEIDDLLTRHVAARLGRRAGERLGAGRRRRRRRAVAGPRAGPRAAAWHLRARAACGSHGWPRASRPATWPGPTACSTRRCSPSASPGASPPTSGPRSCSRSPSGCGACCCRTDRPVQFVFAGKAHPADEPGKAMIQQHPAASPSDPSVRHRFVFLDDYDIAVARALYQGADVWLNNPRRPQEACGTSGMKAALNGALNCSILDGWWDECFDGTNGWAITSAEGEPDLDRRDAARGRTACSTCSSSQIVPLFYDRAPEGPCPGAGSPGEGRAAPRSARRSRPAAWCATTSQELYEPAAAATDVAARRPRGPGQGAGGVEGPASSRPGRA